MNRTGFYLNIRNQIFKGGLFVLLNLTAEKCPIGTRGTMIDRFLLWSIFSAEVQIFAARVNVVLYMKSSSIDS
ncbi:hypothetical protein BIW53_20405 [Pseudoalteromonas byunsanensis]|uniref:Uncharacterized protein n=1 Tax=Pseudoalteromonas byunsanensis TaxID=327939 RepID=A0A1S1N2U0_9GAMM|nr:hypothetical protein BIW53_20405 [Pseudoalteromonas byunsanensis]